MELLRFEKKNTNKSMFRKEAKVDISVNNANNNSVMLSQSNDLFEKLKLLNSYKDFIKKYHLKPIHKYYFLRVTCSSVQFNTFVLMASWLLRKCDIHFSIELNKRKNQHLLLDHILKYLENVDHSINFTKSTLKEGAGKSVIEILDFLTDKALEKCHFQWQKPRVINCGAINVEQISTINDQNSFDNDDNVQFEQNSNVELKSAKDWYEEVERVSDRLKVQLRTEIDDWRYHYEEMKMYHKRMSNDFLTPIRNNTNNLIANLDENLEKIENRDRNLNENFDHLLAKYRLSNDNLLNLKEKHEKLQKQLKSKNLQLTEINDQIKDFREQLSFKDTSAINESPIMHIKKAISSLKSEIQEFDVRIDVLQVGLLQYRIGERKEVHSTEVC